jgi:sulfite exporter TauE/SafE
MLRRLRVDLFGLPWLRIYMTKKRFTFAQMDGPPEERSIESGLRVFLAAMVIWVGLYMPGLTSQGQAKQLATRFAQDIERILP